MYLAGRDAKVLPCAQGNAGKQRGRVMRIEPVERTAQTVVAQIRGGDSRYQEMLDGLGGEELRHQVESAIAKAQAVEGHRDRRGAHTHPLVRALILCIQPLREPNPPS